MLAGRLVRLRALEETDLERVHTWINDREVTQFLDLAGYPLSLADERRWLEGQQTNSFERGMRLAIETEDGTHIGNLGLHPARPEDRKALLDIIIGEKEYWSKGYGTDAVLTLLRFAFGEMNLQRVWLTLHEANERAIGCYRKCGFKEEGRLRKDRFRGGRYWDVLVMGILRDEFEALHGKSGSDEEEL